MNDSSEEELKKKDDIEVIEAGDDIQIAVNALAEGKRINFEQPRQVSTLLDELKSIADEAKSSGTASKTYDLCKVTVQQTNLFCIESKGIPRVQMPQLKGAPTEGSKAHDLDAADIVVRRISLIALLIILKI